MRLLVVEDEPKIAAFISKGLSENGIEVVTAYDGESGLRMATQEDFDLLILDVMLPLMSGIEVCKRLRAKCVNTPILMLTALGTLDDKVQGLQQGADDYLVKPFHFKELLARIAALTRRKNLPFANSVLSLADLTLDRNQRFARRDDKEIILTAREYALLEMFMLNTNRVLSRADIAETVWGYDFDSNSNVIEVYINYLRNKIEKGFSSKLIHTVVGMGYIMREQ